MKKNRTLTQPSFVKHHLNVTMLVAYSFIIIGIIIFVLSIGYIWNGIVSSSWPNTQGRVLHTKVERVTSAGGGPRGGSGSSVSFKPIVEYSYFVDREEYFGNCYAFGILNYKRAEDAQKIIDSFQYNSQITVYYCPSKPQKSVLKPGITKGAIYKCYFSIVWTLVGITVYLLKRWNIFS